MHNAELNETMGVLDWPMVIAISETVNSMPETSCQAVTLHKKHH